MISKLNQKRITFFLKKWRSWKVEQLSKELNKKIYPFQFIHNIQIKELSEGKSFEELSRKQPAIKYRDEIEEVRRNAQAVGATVQAKR